MQQPEAKPDSKQCGKWDRDHEDTLQVTDYMQAEPEVIPFCFDELSSLGRKKVTIELGTTRLHRRHLKSLEPGHVLALDNATDDDVLLRSADGNVLAFGRLVVLEGRVAIRIHRPWDGEKRNVV